ncbi:uncharacterized protein LOC143844154 [Paroedura picta]|uniref:uncharacterized protein LOC143844154 n=1 Tax=Paroedura picta TaxID=143630 RepID=UPI0040563A93
MRRRRRVDGVGEGGGFSGGFSERTTRRARAFRITEETRGRSRTPLHDRDGKERRALSHAAGAASSSASRLRHEESGVADNGDGRAEEGAPKGVSSRAGRSRAGSLHSPEKWIILSASDSPKVIQKSAMAERVFDPGPILESLLSSCDKCYSKNGVPFI